MPNFNQPDPPVFPASVMKLETTDLLLGGDDDAPLNRAARDLVLRTAWLKAQVDALANSVGELGFSWDDIAGKPASFPATAHQHSLADLTDLVVLVNNLGAATQIALPDQPSAGQAVIIGALGPYSQHGVQVTGADIHTPGNNTLDLDIDGAVFLFYWSEVETRWRVTLWGQGATHESHT